MKLSYKIHIHRYPDDRTRKNTTHIITGWLKKGDEYAKTKYKFCCPQIEKAVNYGYIVIAVTQLNFNHIKYKERKDELTAPVICLRTFDETSCYDIDDSLDEFNMPISNCPFCTAKIEIILVEKKRITHKCKKSSRMVEECEDTTTEEIITV